MDLSGSMYNSVPKTFLISIILSNFALCMSEDVVVTVTQGQVRGIAKQTAFGVTYYSFQGIPYAQPPVGSLRFKAPEPAVVWEGVRNATEAGSICIQPDGAGNEDCLFVNIVTPKLPKKADEVLLPTMVYIHGGAFLGGNGGNVPAASDLYLGKGLVMASLNYRLGPLGFLSTGDAVVPGNNGLKDQVKALRWIQQNIAQFGGDPSNITIFGQSAGGASVHFQVLSPLTKDISDIYIFYTDSDTACGSTPSIMLSVTSYWYSSNSQCETMVSAVYTITTTSTLITKTIRSQNSLGLFQRAIAHSGSALNPWAFEDTSSARSRTLRYCKALGADTDDSTELVEFLRTLTSQEIVDGVGKAQTELERNHGISFFKPTVEQDAEISEETFLAEQPLEIMRKGTFNHVPFITGTDSQEGILQLGEVNGNPNRLEHYDTNFTELLPGDINVETSQLEELADKVKKFYFGDKKLSQETLVQYINLIGDTQFANGVNTHARMLGSISTANVYQYCFTYHGRLGFWKRSNGDFFPGIPHGDEEGYLFYYPVSFNVEGSPDIDTVLRMLQLWTNTAIYGNPTPQEDPMLQNITWSPVTELDHFYLDIGNDLIIRRNLDNDRMAFWEDIYADINQ